MPIFTSPRPQKPTPPTTTTKITITITTTPPKPAFLTSLKTLITTTLQKSRPTKAPQPTDQLRAHELARERREQWLLMASGGPLIPERCHDRDVQRGRGERLRVVNGRRYSGVEHYAPYYDNSRMQSVLDGTEILPGYYEGGGQRQQREPTRKVYGRRMSGVGEYPPYYDDGQTEDVVSDGENGGQTSGIEHEATGNTNGMPMSDVEDYPPYYDDHQPENVVSSVDQQKPTSSLDPLPSSTLELAPNQSPYPSTTLTTNPTPSSAKGPNTSPPKQRPISGTEHYAPMDAIDEYERSNPVALDSVYVMALERGKSPVRVDAGGYKSRKDGVDRSGRGGRDDVLGLSGGGREELRDFESLVEKAFL